MTMLTDRSSAENEPKIKIMCLTYSIVLQLTYNL